MRADGLDERKLATAAHPTWSRDGNRIAFDRGGQIVSVLWYGGGVRLVTDGEDPAYAQNGRPPSFATGRSSSRGNSSPTAPRPRGRA